MSVNPAPLADRWLMVRAEISAPGLWDSSGMSVDIDELPCIPVALADRLERWTDLHDALDEANLAFPNPIYWEQRGDAPLAAFNAEGRAIARAFKDALPPNWTVVHEDIDAWLRPPGTPMNEVRLTLGPAKPPTRYSPRR